MKIGCFIYSDSPKYDKLQECAIKSFKKFHPDINIYVYTSSNTEFNELRDVSSGYKKFLFAREVSVQFGIEKIIILGADTITCGRLDEFINNNDSDILSTLDYPYQLSLQTIPCEQVYQGVVNSVSTLALSFSKNDHVNADVVCFNNIKALEEIINCTRWMANEYGEQGALNYICNIQNKYTNKIVDGDYENSNVVYNARAKGNTTAKSGEKPWFKYTTLFKIEDKKLFTNTHENCLKSKQIKVWHYCDGLGTLNKDNFEKIINQWIENGFNQETKDFFTNECDCGDFFKQKFTI
jgi:hypothetical protein